MCKLWLSLAFAPSFRFVWRCLSFVMLPKGTYVHRPV